MKNTHTKHIIFIIVALLLTACSRAYTSPTIRLCRLNLQIFSGYEIASPQRLAGEIDLGSSTSSYFQGNFIGENGDAYPAIFYFEGPSVHFTIHTEQGDIFGSGMMESSVYSCTGKGGGTQTGPTIGDLGDWRGEWFNEEIPNPQAQATPESSSPISLSFNWAIGICGAVIVVLALTSMLRTNEASSSASRPATVSMRRPSQRITNGNKPPLVEYIATYFTGDNLFDLSIDIKRSERYLGECGIGALNHLDKIAGQATGFEVWLFDPASAETVSKTLMSEYCYHIEGASGIGQVFLIKPQISLQIETRNLAITAQIVELEYDSNSLYPNSVIKKAVIKIEAREKTVASSS